MTAGTRPRSILLDALVPRAGHASGLGRTCRNAPLEALSLNNWGLDTGRLPRTCKFRRTTCRAGHVQESFVLSPREVRGSVYVFRQAGRLSSRRANCAAPAA